MRRRKIDKVKTGVETKPTRTALYADSCARLLATHALHKVVHGLGLEDVREDAVPLGLVQADVDKIEVDLDNVRGRGAVVPRTQVVPLCITGEKRGAG